MRHSGSGTVYLLVEEANKPVAKVQKECIARKVKLILIGLFGGGVRLVCDIHKVTLSNHGFAANLNFCQ